MLWVNVPDRQRLNTYKRVVVIDDMLPSGPIHASYRSDEVILHTGCPFAVLVTGPWTTDSDHAEYRPCKGRSTNGAPCKPHRFTEVLRAPKVPNVVGEGEYEAVDFATVREAVRVSRLVKQRRQLETRLQRLGTEA